jgi:CheY-like chemotaxis protein
MGFNINPRPAWRVSGCRPGTRATVGYDRFPGIQRRAGRLRADDTRLDATRADPHLNDRIARLDLRVEVLCLIGVTARPARRTTGAHPAGSTEGKFARAMAAQHQVLTSERRRQCRWASQTGNLLPVPACIDRQPDAVAGMTRARPAGLVRRLLCLHAARIGKRATDAGVRAGGRQMTGRAAPVLLIDEHDDIREGLRMILEADGWAIETAVDGREALNKIAGGMRPCIILLDLMSPVMNGLEFRRELGSYPHLLPIPIVAYSGLKNVRDRARELANDDGVQLPAEINRLIAAVRQTC